MSVNVIQSSPFEFEAVFDTGFGQIWRQPAQCEMPVAEVLGFFKADQCDIPVLRELFQVCNDLSGRQTAQDFLIVSFDVTSLPVFFVHAGGCFVFTQDVGCRRQCGVSGNVYAFGWPKGDAYWHDGRRQIFEIVEISCVNCHDDFSPSLSIIFFIKLAGSVSCKGKPSGYPLGFLVEATGVEPVSEIYVELTFYMVICNTDTADLGAAALSVRAQAVVNSQGACLCVYAL